MLFGGGLRHAHFQRVLERTEWNIICQMVQIGYRNRIPGTFYAARQNRFLGREAPVNKPDTQSHGIREKYWKIPINIPKILDPNPLDPKILGTL